MKLGKCYRERCFLSRHEYETKEKNSESHEEKHLSLFLYRAQIYHLSYSIWENVVHLKFSRNIIVFKGRAIKCLETRQKTARIIIILFGWLVILNCEKTGLTAWRGLCN